MGSRIGVAILAGLAFSLSATTWGLSDPPHAFQPAVSLGTNASPRGVGTGDVFGDGKTELIVADFGSSTFIGQSTPATLLDSRSSSVQVFAPSPQGLQLAATIPTASSPRGLSLFDLGGKGKDDILVTDYDADLLQAFEWQGGGFVKAAEEPTLKMPVGVAAGVTRPGGASFVAVADFGADSLSLFPVKGGELGKRVDIAVDRGPTQLAIGDINGDGFNEIAVVCLSADKIDLLSVKADDPSSYALSRSIPLPQGSAPADLRLADLDGDGKTDMVAADFLKNEIWIYLQQADGSLAAQPPLPTSGSHPNGLTVADLYRDGRNEIVVANRDSDSLDIFERVDRQFRLGQTLRVGDDPGGSFGPVEVAALDTNGQGQLDLVASHMRSNSIKVLDQVAGATPTPSEESSPVPTASFSGKTTFCYPNPTHDGNTKFCFTLPSPASVTIQVFDVSGERVWSQTLQASQTQEGVNEAAWRGINQGGQNLASGVYFYSITTAGQTVTKRLAILR